MFPDTHNFVILEKHTYSIQKTLSDVGGYDPKVHGGTEVGITQAVLDSLPSATKHPPVARIEKLLKRVKTIAKRLAVSENEIPC